MSIPILIIIVVIALYVLLWLCRHRLLFSQNIACGKCLSKYEYDVIDFSIHIKGDGWLVRKKNAKTDNQKVFAIIMGAGGAKCCYLDIIKSCFLIDSCATVCIVDHLGYGGTRQTHSASLEQIAKDIQRIQDYLVHEGGIQEITWVTHCIGTIFLLKTPNLFNKPTLEVKQKLLVINGLANWYDGGVNFPPFLNWMPRLLEKIVVDSVRKELDARHDLAELVETGVPIACVHTRNNKHVDVEHGRAISKFIGLQHYHEIKKGRHVQLDLWSHLDAMGFIHKWYYSV